MMTATTTPAIIEHQLEHITPETLETLGQYKSRLLTLEQEMKERLLEVGHILSQVNDILIQQKLFEAWIDRNLGWGLSSAYNYMAVWRKFGSLELEGGLNALPIPQSGLYLLAADSVPEETRQSIIERAKQGELFSVNDVKQEIRQDRASRQTAQRQKPMTQDLPPTECLWCGRKNIMIYPLRNTRRGFCGECGAKGLRFIAEMSEMLLTGGEEKS